MCLCRNIWDQLQFQELLQQVCYSPHFNFYEILVRSVHGIISSVTNTDGIDDSNQLTKNIADLTKLLNNSQQRYFSRGYEYFHYILERMQQSTNDCMLDLILDQLENLISNNSSTESNEIEESPYHIMENSNLFRYDLYTV